MSTSFSRLWATSLLSLLTWDPIAFTTFGPERCLCHGASAMISNAPLKRNTIQLSMITRRTAIPAILAGAATGISLGSRLPWSDSPASTAALADEMGSGLLMPGGPSAPYQPVIDGTWTSPPNVQTSLGQSRILASELSPLQPSLFSAATPLSGRDLYYPTYLFGSWNVTATLKRKIYPYGTFFVPSKSLIDGSPRCRKEKVGDVTTYQQHFYYTLPNDLSNNIRVNLGMGVPKSKVIADRAYNAKSASSAYKQLTPVQDVRWDPSIDPTRLTLEFNPGPVGEDMQPLGPRRTEVYITARSTDDDVGIMVNKKGGADGGPNNEAFCAAERSRSVSLSPGNIIVSDMETITEYQPSFVVGSDTNNVDHIDAISRIAVYLTPNPNSREGVLWSQVNGKAVAFFDYELDMKRLYEEFIVGNDDVGTVLKKACVRTPKDVVQCE